MLIRFCELIVKQVKFGLLYITTIILTTYLPRMIFIGYKREHDVSIRVDVKYWFWNFIAGAACWLWYSLSPSSVVLLSSNWVVTACLTLRSSLPSSVT